MNKKIKKIISLVYEDKVSGYGYEAYKIDDEEQEYGPKSMYGEEPAYEQERRKRPEMKKQNVYEDEYTKEPSYEPEYTKEKPAYGSVAVYEKKVAPKQVYSRPRISYDNDEKEENEYRRPMNKQYGDMRREKVDYKSDRERDMIESVVRDILKEKNNARYEQYEKQEKYEREPKNKYEKEIRIPDIRIPEPRIPKIRIPDVRIPDIRVPEVRVPDVRVPDVRIPDIRVPEVKMPEVKMAKKYNKDREYGREREYSRPNKGDILKRILNNKKGRMY